MKVKISAVLLLAGAFLLGSATLRAKNMTLTGEVGDAMCGVKHMMKDATACTKGCVAKGSDYALIVKDKAYTLKATDDQKSELNKMAGKVATVTGDVNGDTITVASLKIAN